MPFSIGLQIGPYRILEQLGQGGMATVYKGYHASLDRYVAIKVLHQAFLEDPNFHARFQREARLVAKLEHPNIVPIYDYAEHEGQPFLVMKYIEGETLKARLQRGPLNATEVTTIIETVGAGLAYAHKQGILHRDIKPSNVILANDGSIYLADFGLARIAQSGESTLTSDMVLGTPQYISPEQAMAKKDLDDGTDIYSFGVMLYEMTVGRVPFSADTPFSVIHDHIYSPLPLPTSVNPKISPDLERVLLKALAKDRADRYKDVPAFVEAFKSAWMNSASTVAVTPVDPEASTVPPSISSPLTMPAAPGSVPSSTPAPAAVSPVKKKLAPPVWLWVLIVLGIVLCLVAAFFAWRGFQRNRQRANQPSAATATLIATQPPAPTQPPPAVEQPQAPVDEAAPLEMPPLGVDEAKKQVDERPNDPIARWQFGVALVKNGQGPEGYQEIRKGAELAAGNRALLIGAARAIEEKAQLPLGAAILYLQAADKVRPNAPGAEMLTDNLHRAIYFAFGDPLAPEVIPFEKLAKTDPALETIARVRHDLVSNLGDYNPTQNLIDDWRLKQPGLAETDLLQGELLLVEQKPDEARKFLLDVSQRPNIPQWIAQRANELLKKLP